jgi:TPR repeat protein
MTKIFSTIALMLISASISASLILEPRTFLQESKQVVSDAHLKAASSTETLDDAENYFRLSARYFFGSEPNKALSDKFLIKAAELGNAKAQLVLSTRYANGSGGFDKNPQLAFQWMSKAAEKGDLAATYNFGMFLFYGIGVDKNYESAAEWLSKAAELGHADAQYALGMFFFSGYGVQKDNTRAVKWFHEAAKQGHVKASKIISDLMSAFKRVPLDMEDEKHIQALRDIAEQGNVSASYALGLGYHKNRNKSPEDEDHAVKWLLNAAELGHTEAQALLAAVYSVDGRYRNDVHAIHWHQRAAEQGNLESVYFLGAFYALGRGASTDHLLACALLKAYALMGGKNDAMLTYIASAEKKTLKNKIKAVNELAIELAKPNNFSDALSEYVASLNR